MKMTKSLHLIMIEILILLLCPAVICQVCSVSKPNVAAMSTQLQELTSPGYNAGGGTYISNMDCYWIIDSGADDLNVLIFLTYDTACPGDKIFIYDGKTTSSSVLAHALCGTSTAPVDYSTTQRHARIEMQTDDANEKAGFKLHYLAAKDFSSQGCNNTQVLRATAEYQYLSSPNFPGKYNSNSDCRWNLYNPFGVVDIEVIIADIEDGNPNSCKFDKYQIFDGENKCDNNVAQIVCSEYPKTSPFNYASSGTNAVVTFFSDSSVNNRGFLLRFKATDLITISTDDSTLYSETKARSTYMALETTASTTKRYRQDTSKGSHMSTEIILGIVFGSLILICFTIITVVFVVTRVNVPSERSVTPTEVIRRSPSIAWSIRSRKPSRTSNTITQSIFVTDETLRGDGSAFRNGAPPRATANNLSLSMV